MEQPLEEDACSKLQEFYPHLSPEELKIAETNLKQYLKDHQNNNSLQKNNIKDNQKFSMI